MGGTEIRQLFPTYLKKLTSPSLILSFQELLKARGQVKKMLFL